MQLFVGQLLNGVIVGSLYAIVALGLTLTFGITGIVNFALGEFMMLGAYFTWVLVNSFGFPFPLALLSAVLLTAFIGFITDQLMFRHTRQHLINGLLISTGLTLIIQAAVLYIWTSTPQQMSHVLTGVVSVGGVTLPTMRVVAFLTLLAVIAGTYLALSKTWSGRGAYAFAQNEEAARLMGVRTGLVQSGVVVYSTALAAVGGGLYASLYSLEPSLGGVYMLKGVAAAIVGGIGSIPGSLLGGLLLGVTETIGSTYLSSALRDAYGLIFVIAILIFKPRGLWSRT